MSKENQRQYKYNNKQNHQKKTNKQRFDDLELKQSLMSKEFESMQKQIATGITNPGPKKETSASTFDQLSKKINDLFLMGNDDPEQTYDLPAEVTEQTIYTDAWSEIPYITFCAGVYERLLDTDDRFKMHMFDFLLLCEAALQESLRANPEIIGVDGWTRDDVTNAKDVLAQLEIPDVVATAIATYRPISVTETGVKVVLLPYTYHDPGNNAVGRAAGTLRPGYGNNIIFRQAVAPVNGQGGAPADFDIQLRDAITWRKNGFAAPVAVAQPGSIDNGVLVRRALLPLVLHDWAPVGPAILTMNQAVNALIEEHNVRFNDHRSILQPRLGGNISIGTSYYSFVLGVVEHITHCKTLLRLSGEVGGPTWFKSRVRREVPYMILNNHQVVYTGTTVVNKFLPLFVFDAQGHVVTQNQRLSGTLGYAVSLWFVRAPKYYISPVMYSHYATALKRLAHGEPTALRALHRGTDR